MSGTVKITKNAVVSKYKYFGYGIGLDGRGSFLHSSGSFGNNVIIFGVNMSSTVHVDNKKKGLILGEGPTQGIGWYNNNSRKPINFTETRKKFCLDLHYNAANSFLFVNGREI